MPWFRLTTRRIMAVVLVLAVLLGLGIPAVQVGSDRAAHVHRWVTQKNGQVVTVNSANFRSAFWPRYWRCLLGRPWRRFPVCTTGEVYYAEVCEFEHPELMVETAPGIWSTRDIAAQRLARNQIKMALTRGTDSLPSPLGP